jgi:hypothetical protein
MNMTLWDIISSRSNCKDGISAKIAYPAKAAHVQGHHLCKDAISAKTASP